MDTETKAMALVAAIETHAQTLRSLIGRSVRTKDQNALRSVLEAHEGYIKACEEELIQRELTKRRSVRNKPETHFGSR